MRICFISHSAERFGAEIALLELLEGLQKRGVNCMVVVPKTGPLLDDLDRLNIPWQISSYPTWINYRSSLPSRFIRFVKTIGAVPTLVRIFRQFDCDIVYTNTVVVPAGAIAARLIKKPHVWHSHESGFHDPLIRLDLGQRLSTQIIGRLSTAVIVVSKSLVDDYRKYLATPEKIKLIYQAVTLRPKSAEISLLHHRRSFQCIMVASIQPLKGQEEAILAVAELVRRGIDVGLTIVGKGRKKYQAKLAHQIESLGLQQHVKFEGYVSNPVPLIASADALLVCSQWEAFGRVTIEAMLAGTPVIGSARGATTELISDGHSGLLYEFGQPLHLAEKIQFLEENPNQRVRLAAAAKSWAEARFTRERYAKEVFDVLSTLMHKSQVEFDDINDRAECCDGLGNSK